MTGDGGHTKQPMLKVIRAKCLDCAGSPGEVRQCSVQNCPLWPYRMGKNPFRRGRVLEASEAKAMQAKRAAKPGRPNQALFQRGGAS